jgi:hypothetical protein
LPLLIVLVLLLSICATETATKPGRASYEEAKSHRPISLSSFLLKTLERLVDWHIRSTSLVRNPLCKNQHAYQRGKSTMSALHKFTQNVESALKYGEFALASFLDIEISFDKEIL